MEENLTNPLPAEPAAPVVVFDTKPDASKNNLGETKKFFAGLFFGLAGAILLSLLDLLFIAKVNPANDALITFLVVFGPVLICSLYIFFFVYYFRRQRNIFMGLLVSLLIFIFMTMIFIEFSTL